MVKLNVGQEVPLNEVRHGNKDGREWMMVLIKSDKGYDSIAAFVSNAEEAKNFTSAKVKKILGVEKTARKFKDKFYDSFSCTVELEGVDGNAGLKNAGFNRFQSAVQSSRQSGSDFVPIPDNLSDEGLPFN